MTTRREFLKATSAVLGAGALGGLAPRLAFAADDATAAARPTLVTIYLRGGADVLSVVVPYGEQLYYKYRPTTAIPAQAVGDVKGIIPITSYFGVHPSLEPLSDLLKAGLAAPIINVGSTHPTRSHFDAQDFMERAAPGVKTITEGWLNRYLELTRKGDDQDFRAVSLQPTLPRSLRGQYPVLAVPDVDGEGVMGAFDQMYPCLHNGADQPAGTPGAKAGAAPAETAVRDAITDSGGQSIRKLRELRRILDQAGKSAAEYPQSGFGRQMRDLASIIKAQRGLEVAALDYHGWDTHAYQGNANGDMAGKLADLSASVAAFARDLGPRFGRTLVLVMSEFGRTARENGNNGTDHGHGGVMLAIGGMVKGRQVYGQWTGLDPQTLYERRDLPVTTDFRLIFHETLHQLFAFDSNKHKFFPDYKHNPRPLGFLNAPG
ncbi:MAG: DUF1501 domain-containing protein [Phycisphaeraceae bacterium]